MVRARNSRALLIISIIIAVGVGFLFLPVRHWFSELQGRIEGLGTIGPIVFAAAYVLLTVLLVPGSVLTFGAGTIFGLRIGAITVIIGSNLGALCSFLLSRSLLRKKVERWALENQKFSALDRAVGQEAFKMVLLSRFSPIFPFTLLNYLLGLTGIRIRSYLLANLIGMLPGTFLYVYLGAAARQALNGGGGNATVFTRALEYFGLLATVAVVVLVTRAAKRAMEQIENVDAGQAPDVKQDVKQDIRPDIGA